MTAVTTTVDLTVLQAPSMQIELAPAELTVVQGTSGTITVNATREGGFAGDITISAEDLPAGVTIADATIASGAGSTTLDIDVASDATLGEAEITIRATGDDVEARTATLSLSVASAGEYSLAVSPTSVSIAQGAAGSATLALTRTQFPGTVSFTAEDAPEGITVTFDPAETAADETTVNISVAETVAVGTHTITLRGTATGLEDRTTTIDVEVTSGGTSGGNVAFAFCEASGLPVWVAAQDGDGAWMRVLDNDADDEYSFQIDAERGGVAWVVDEGGDAFTMNVLYFSREQLQAQGGNVCDFEAGDTRSVTVDVEGLGATDQALVTLGNVSGIVSGATPSIELEGVAPGTVDLVASQFTLSESGLQLERILIDRDLDPAGGATLTADLGGSSAFVPDMNTVTIGNIGGDDAFSSLSFITAGGTLASLGTNAEAGASQEFAAIPASAQVSGDLHLLSVFAQEPGNEPTSMRFGQRVFASASDLTIDLGPALSLVEIVVVDTDPYVRLRAEYAVQSEYATWHIANFSQESPERDVSIQMSSEYLGDETTVSLEIPDLSGVAGWNDDWGLTAGVATTWLVTALGFDNGNLIDPFTEGASWLSAIRTGTITP